MNTEHDERRPEEIEARIEQKRAALDSKLQELERRLSPREQLSRVRERLNPEAYTGLAAVGAIAAGAYMAVSGWRRYHHANGHSETHAAAAALPIDEVMILPICEDDRSLR